MFGLDEKWKKTAILLSVSAGVTAFTLWKTWIKLKHNVVEERNINLQDASSYIKEKNIVIVTSSQEWDAVFPKLIDGLKYKKVLGLDCEWVAKNKVALLQLCTPCGLCVLVRLSMMSDPFPKTLVSLLADKSILKTGVAVVNDGKKLQVDYGLTVVGCVDLRHLLERVSSLREVFNCPSKGLKGLSSEILHVELSKNPHIRCGNWEADNYTHAQINYAAADAAVGVDIFIKLVLVKMGFVDSDQSMSNNNSPTQLPASNSNRNDEVSEEEFWKVSHSMCQGVVDAGYSSSNDGGQTSSRNPSKKLKDDNKIYSTRQRPLWDNCRLEAPDGTALCTCDRRKAQWYLDKELGDKVSDDPIIVRLRFEPSSRPESETNYYLQEKENQCVVCGSDKDYVRKFVIPFEYKKFFPSALKDHSSHDVLLLCTSCHRQSCDHDSILRQRLAQECSAPIDSGSTSRTVVDHDLQKVKSAGRALTFNRSSIPPNRVEELEKILLDFFGADALSDEILERAFKIDFRQASEDYVPHGKRVVRHMVMNGGLLAFQARWRQHFLDTMDPHFMPAFWSVDYVPDDWSKVDNTSSQSLVTEYA